MHNCALWKAQNEGIPKVPPEGQMEEWKALKIGVKAANVPTWAQRSQESMWELGVQWEMGQDSERRNVRCAQKTIMWKRQSQ
jgi:hypothetical protein